MRVGLYQKFFTWAMLNLVLLGVITALFIGGVLLFNNNLYSPMLFNGSIASTFRMTSVELQYKPESQWASVLEECGRECGLHFGILILDDMDPPLAAGGLPPRVVEAARTIPRPPYSLCAEPDSGAFSTITPAVELEAEDALPGQVLIPEGRGAAKTAGERPLPVLPLRPGKLPATGVTDARSVQNTAAEGALGWEDEVQEGGQQAHRFSASASSSSYVVCKASRIPRSWEALIC